MKKTNKRQLCGKKYVNFMFDNYNLDLCQGCFEKNENLIERDEMCDKVTHQITCPRCKKVYKKFIVDEKCKTKNCNVWFFWDSLDGQVFARWIDIKK